MKRHTAGWQRAPAPAGHHQGSQAVRGAAVQQAAHGRLRISLRAAVPGRVVVRSRYEHFHQVAAADGCTPRAHVGAGLHGRGWSKTRLQDAKRSSSPAAACTSVFRETMLDQKANDGCCKSACRARQLRVTRGAPAWGPADRRSQAAKPDSSSGATSWPNEQIYYTTEL